MLCYIINCCLSYTHNVEDIIMLVRISSYQTSLEAHIARGRLEAEGIPAIVCHEHHVGVDWTMALALAQVKLYVHPDDTSRAIEIISAHNRGEFALEDGAPVTCPRCDKDDIARLRRSWKWALLAANLAAIPLYFKWATLKCRWCRYEWDLPDTNDYPLIAPFIVALFVLRPVIAILTLLLSRHCLDGVPYWLIFPLTGGCRDFQ
jgi:hypothetical protein